LTCRESAVELVECARAGQLPGAGLQIHLTDCPRCQERWEDERRLTAHFRIMRDKLACRPSMAGREQLMREFEHAHAGGFQAMWRWALNAAAILLVLVALVYDWHNHGRNMAQQHKSSSGLQAESQPDSASDESDFVEVPYALPLASGELVRVVRTQLDPVALAGMGVDIEAADGAEIPADVLLGEDGLPRGVRVLPEAGFLNLE
jgi:hypothetical protein